MPPGFPPYEHSPGIGTLPVPFFGTDARDRRGLGSLHTPAALRAAPHVTAPPRPTGYPAGLFSGSAMEQAQKIADYLFAPYQSQYQSLTSQHQQLDQQRLAQLQAYIDRVASGLQGVAPQVLQAYQGAAQDQVSFAQGFSDAVKGAVQDSAGQDNQILSQIGAPSGQNIPDSQAVGVGDVLFGTGGYIPATSLAAQGARAYAEAAGLPAMIHQRGLGAISDLLGKQQDEQSALDSAYQQQLAQRPQSVLDLYGQIKDRQAKNQAMVAKARSDAIAAGNKARADALDRGQRQADTLTRASGYLYVVTRTGQVKRATDRAGKPILTLEGQKAAQGSAPKIHYYQDGAGVWHAVNESTGQTTALPGAPKPGTAPTLKVLPNGDTIQWNPATGAWDPVGNFAKPPPPPTPPAPLVVGSSSAGWTIYDRTTGKVIGTKPPGAAKPVIKTDPRTGLTTAVDPTTGTIIWRQRTGTPTPATATEPKPPSVQHLPNGALAVWQLAPDGKTWKLVPITRARPAKAGRADATGIFDPDTQQQLTRSQVAQAAADVRATIGGARKRGLRIEDVIGRLKQEGVPESVWAPIVARAYNLPRSTKDLKFMGLPRLHNLAVFLGYQPDPAHPLDKQGLIEWITANGPKGQAAAETAATGRTGEYAYPLQARGKVIGFPYQGTHLLYGNWESDNAVDISIPVGTPVYAVADGTIGSQIGPLDSSGDPRLAGNRVHLETGDNEFYYAHLSRLTVKAGQHVKRGDLIGYSGEANGTPHLHIAARDGNPVSYFTPKAAGGQTIKPQASADVKLATTPGGARRVAKRLAQMRGWTGKKWRDLNLLIQGESGWNYRAWHNPSTDRPDVWSGNAPPPHGAFGIGQALGHDLPPDYATNPVTQIQWMLDYVRDRYDNDPSKALAFKQTHGWY